MLVPVFLIIAVFGFAMMVLSVMKPGSLIFPLLAFVTFFACAMFAINLETYTVTLYENTTSGGVQWMDNTATYQGGYLAMPYFFLLGAVMLILAIYEYLLSIKHAVVGGEKAVTGV